jgi:hypothetical protein
MISWNKKYLIFAMNILLSTSCSNMLSDTANKDTKEAVFYDAQRKMDKHDYSGAIDAFESLGTDFLTQRDVAVIYASAYSGRCGLDFVSLIESLKDFSGTTPIFLMLMDFFPGGSDAKIADCVKSEGILTGIGDLSVRNANENILLGFSSFAKMGIVLSRFADTDGNGTVDAGFDHCDTTILPDDAVREIGTGLAFAVQGVQSAGDGIGGSAITDILNFCGLNPLLANFCTTTDKAAFTTQEVSAMRAVIGSSEQGLGSCSGDFTTCICP